MSKIITLPKNHGAGYEVGKIEREALKYKAQRVAALLQNIAHMEGQLISLQMSEQVLHQQANLPMAAQELQGIRGTIAYSQRSINSAYLTLAAVLEEELEVEPEGQDGKAS